MEVLKMELKKSSLLYKNVIFVFWLITCALLILLKGPGEYQSIHNGVTERLEVNFIVEVLFYFTILSIIVILRRIRFLGKYRSTFLKSPIYQGQREISLDEDIIQIETASITITQPISTVNEIIEKNSFYLIQTSNNSPFILTKEGKETQEFINILCRKTKVNVC